MFLFSAANTLTANILRKVGIQLGVGGLGEGGGVGGGGWGGQEGEMGGGQMCLTCR